MAHFFSSGLAADLALALILLEAVFLWARRRRAGSGLGLSDFAPFLLAGAFLILALRAALVDAPWWCVATALAASGVAHAVDLRRRFRA